MLMKMFNLLKSWDSFVVLCYVNAHDFGHWSIRFATFMGQYQIIVNVFYDLVF